mgnify:CR=1 FL=1
MRRAVLAVSLLATSICGHVASPLQAQGAPEIDPTTPVGYRVVNGIADTVNPIDVAGITRDTGLTTISPSLGQVPDARSVIGPDERGMINNTNAFPYRSFGAVDYNGLSNNCTGWLVSPDTVVTAGHCLARNGQVASNLTFSPARNGTSEPFGTAAAREIWVDRFFPERSGHDWGVVKLAEPVGNTVGWIGLKNTQDATWVGSTQTITGYPADKPAGTMWSANGDITAETGNTFTHTIDTLGGQSGSAIYRENYAIGIHVTGGSQTNTGTRITDELFDTIVNLTER